MSRTTCCHGGIDRHIYDVLRLDRNEATETSRHWSPVRASPSQCSRHSSRPDITASQVGQRARSAQQTLQLSAWVHGSSTTFRTLSRQIWHSVSSSLDLSSLRRPSSSPSSLWIVSRKSYDSRRDIVSLNAEGSSESCANSPSCSPSATAGT